MQNFTITTTGPGASGSNNYGALALDGGVLNLTDGTITTTFPQNHGLFADNAPSQITATYVTVNTSGFSAHAAAADDGGHITINGGSLKTTADGTTAILVIRGGSQDVPAVSVNGTTITTTGFGSSGAEAYDGSRVDLHNATVLTMNPANALFTSNAFGTIPSTFLVDGGSVTANQGAAIGVSSVGATFILQNGAIVSGMSSDGVSGGVPVPRVMNVDLGGDATLQADSATLNGGIFVDSTSTANATLANKTVMTGDSLAQSGGTLNINLLSGSTWTGAALPVTNVTVDPSSSWTITADSTVTSTTTNAGLIAFTPPGAGAFKTLTTTNYVGQGGTLGLNTFLGTDGSPSDKLIITNGGTASGNSLLRITNAGGPGAETLANGILVVQAINGGTTAGGAFALSAGELRAGAFDYDLFRGGVAGSSPNDWFLRSSLVVEPPVVPPETSPPTTPPTTPPVVPPVVPPVTSLPTDPPPNPLPPGVAFPIIGPELATYGVVQPLARQLGLSILGTLDDRVGDTYEPDGCGVAPAVASAAAETSAVDLPTRKPAAVPTKKPGPAPCPLFSPSVWGRFFGQTIHNNYQAFAAPSASGDLGGFQGGIDLLRGSLIAGQYERAGLYGAYGDVHADVNGLVTNPAATAYVLTHTGSMNLNSWSAGGYWTHTGPGGWYLDAVLQGTWYYGSASTQFARLNTDGTGFIASLEGGYPYAWPQLGPGFVIEPQGQILWQKVSFRHDYDGLGDVALGDTTGPSGRIGLRTKWTIVTGGGQVWQPYLRANLWRDWGADTNAVYSGTDIVPLESQVTRLELGGGLTGRINANVSVFANVDYEFAVGGAENEKQSGVRGAFGARYTW